jgi:O-methyltransferase domain/Dimerisation domain
MEEQMTSHGDAASSNGAPGPRLQELITGYWVSQGVCVAAELGLADLLAGGPRSVRDLAQETGVLPEPLHRLLRALASVGVFREDESEAGVFSLTWLADGLRSDVPHSQRAFALLQRYQYRPWGELRQSLETGLTSFDRVHGSPLFEFLAEQPDAASVFNAAMADRTVDTASAVVAAYDFSRVHRLVDIGGGSGLLLTTVLAANPTLHGVLFDLPHVAAEAHRRIADEGLSDRCVARGGDFFESVPEDADAYLLKWILHDWDDNRATAVLRQCREVMGPDDRILVVEAVIPPGNDPAFAKWLDLTMLTITGGRERSAAEYDELFAAADLRLTRVLSTSSEASILEGVPA